MEALFSTAAVHPRDRFDCWHHVACGNITGHDSVPEDRFTFHAKLESGTLSDIGLILFENSPMVVVHEARHIAHSNSDELIVCRQIAGSFLLEQDDREAALEPGDITLLDPRLPYAGKFFEGSTMLVLKIPRSALAARLGVTSRLTARRVGSSDAETSLTSAFVAMLPAHVGKLGTTAEDVVREQVLDLITLSFAKSVETPKTPTSTARSLVALRVRAAIEAKLNNPALDSETVAASAGVSVRYANAVLAEEGMSITRLIQARRIERCRRALEDPAQNHRTVSEIAYSWGFCDMTHFGRRFKAAYGTAPREYRRRQN